MEKEIIIPKSVLILMLQILGYAVLIFGFGGQILDPSKKMFSKEFYMYALIGGCLLLGVARLIKVTSDFRGGSAYQKYTIITLIGVFLLALILYVLFR